MAYSTVMMSEDAVDAWAHSSVESYSRGETTLWYREEPTGAVGLWGGAPWPIPPSTFVSL